MSEADVKVIQISDWRAGKQKEPTWIFDLRIHATADGDYQGVVLDFNDDPGMAFNGGVGDRMRAYADALDHLSWLLRQQAEQLDPGDRGIPIATAVIFENSAVRVRVNDERLITDEQFAWLDKRFDDAKEASRPPTT